MDPFQPGLLQRIKPPRRVVIVHTGQMGSLLCATPALRSLRAALPRTHISLMASLTTRHLVDRFPYIDRYIPFPGFPGMDESQFEPRRTVAFLESMQARRFDLAVQLQGPEANSFALLLGARSTAGFIVAGGDAGCLDAALPYPGGHAVDRALALVEFLGAPRAHTTVEFPLTIEEVSHAAALLGNAPAPLIGVHAGGRRSTRRWFPDRFAAAARELQRLHGGTILILGEEVADGDYPAATRNLAGRTTLGVLGGVIRRLDLLITNDALPAQIAYALGTPTITIFGGSDPDVWSARHATASRVLAHPVQCRPCRHDVCPVGYLCLDNVHVSDVVNAAGRLLNRYPQPAATPAASAVSRASN